MYDSQPEEHKHRDQSKRDEEDDMLHGDVELPAHRLFAALGSTLELTSRQTDRLTDDGP